MHMAIALAGNPMVYSDAVSLTNRYSGHEVLEGEGYQRRARLRQAGQRQQCAVSMRPWGRERDKGIEMSTSTI